MTDEEQITTRMLNVLPPRSFELLTFFSLFRVRFSDEVETACVTCSTAPELLLNRRFVEEHCRSDEHLLMLVMHELYHVILGHTRLFPRPNKISNIVFDAVINAILCSLFPDPAFTSFFTDYYPPDRMPLALLRPKGEGTPPEAEAPLRLLYDQTGTGTYHDVFMALMKNAVLLISGDGPGGGGGEGESGSSGSTPDKNGTPSSAGKGEDSDEPILLGSHGDDNGEMSPEMKELLHEIISKWPSPDRKLAGRDLGAEPRERDFGVAEEPDTTLRLGICKLMRKAAIEGPTERRRRAVRERMSETSTFLPVWTDRSHEARKALLGDALVYRAEVAWRRPVNRDRRKTFVYLDVSGSVADEVPRLARTLKPFLRRGLCSVHVFSTVVKEATVRDLAAGKFTSTGGTSIDCVLEHALSLPREKRPRSIIVITDGETGRPAKNLAADFQRARMKMFVGLIGGGPHDGRDLSGIAESLDRLIV
jgi:hypothetical protein